MTEITPGTAVPAPPAPAPSRWRVRNAIVEAVQWTGANEAEVTEFAKADRLIAGRIGSHFDVLDAEDRANCDDPEATAQLHDKARSRWVLVKDGGWIVKGITGLLFAVGDEKFREDYEPVTEAPAPAPAAAPVEALAAAISALLEAAKGKDEASRAFRGARGAELRGEFIGLNAAATLVRERLAPQWAALTGRLAEAEAELQQTRVLGEQAITAEREAGDEARAALETLADAVDHYFTAGEAAIGEREDAMLNELHAARAALGGDPGA